MKSAPSLEGMLKGVPEVILQPPTSPSVLITWLHTNEELAPRFMHHILTKRPDLAPFVSFVCGNPQIAATNRHKGFGQTDLNRSFNVSRAQSYEEKRAPYIAELAKKYTYVIDLHTTVGVTGEYIITAPQNLSAAIVRELIAASKNRRVVVMPEVITRHSLLGSAPNAIALEYYEGHLNRGIRDVEHIVESLVTGVRHTPFEREFLYVDGVIPKTADPGLATKNFQFVPNAQGGYFPILLGTGPRSYREDPTKDYCCLAARHKEVRAL